LLDAEDISYFVLFVPFCGMIVPLSLKRYS
jgi:hypothetical protein